MFSNEKKTAKPGKTPDNYKQQVHYKLDSAFEGLDIVIKDQQDDIISFKKGYPIEHQVADCDNDTTIPYGDDQPFSQSSPIKSNPFFSSWTGPQTLPSSITPSPQHLDALYPSLTTTATTAIATVETSALTTTSSVTTTATSGTGAGPGQTTLPSINSSEMQYNSLRTCKPSMWGTLFSCQYEDYSLEAERVDQLESLFWIMFDNLRDEGKQYPTAAYMIPNTEQQSESDTWKSKRWFGILASISKQASNLGNILNTETQYCDSTKRKLFNFISYNILALHTFSTPATVYGIESVEQARADYSKYMAGKIQDFRVTKTGFWINKLWLEIGWSCF
ncbi:unnamed protein product [Mytilus edulis]|uniref:Uncharacterized protein n=1 Tax=Mytilus edulis TaxID=6550 RepID=A0A8S3S4W6_MYTED|nr:unnamed protein product [Mytilus edulis]